MEGSYPDNLAFWYHNTRIIGWKLQVSLEQRRNPTRAGAESHPYAFVGCVA